MVAMEWFFNVGKKSHQSPRPPLSSPPIFGILSFETAKTMSSLISLYNSLSEDEVSRLRREIIGSQGVSYLNSKDEGFLLGLAFWEWLEELDCAANCAARLGRNCSAFGLKRFDLVYADMKAGLIEAGKIGYGSKDVEKMIAKMEKYVSATSMLHSVGESLREMEISERKMKQWNKNSDAKLPGKGMNFDLFDEKIGFLRKQVKKYRESSLWNQTFDKGVALMARLICVIYVRLCLVFRSHIAGNHLKDHRVSKSGPIPKGTKRMALPVPRFHSQELNPNISLSDDIGFGHAFGIGTGRQHRSATSHMQPVETFKRTKVFQGASPLTVGGSGLTTRYANVILLAERYLEEPESISANARDDLYQMLSENVKIALRSKLRKSIEKLGEEEENDEMLAEGWREGLKGILVWIGPMAHDTIHWQMQRNQEKQGFDAKPKVLLLQTLHYSDIVKTEAAIVELLVGLSHVCRYENRQSNQTVAI